MNKLKFCTSFVHLRGKRIDFSGRPYLPEIYTVRKRNLVLRCSRQVEKSTFLCNTILYEACTRPGVQMLYVCPREEQVRRFSHDRLIPTIEESPSIRKVLLGNSRRKPPVMNIKFRNGSRLYLGAAYTSAGASRGISADLLLVDEFQDIAAGHLPVLQETLSHAKAGRTILSGTPLSTENHLQAVFSQSTRHEWQVPCKACGKAAILDEKCLGQQSVICPACSAELDTACGQWVARNPSARWNGYWINHLMVPWVAYDKILESQRSYDMVSFKNEVLGLPSTIGDAVVSRAEMEACCSQMPMAKSLDDIAPQGRNKLVCGIDWGGGSVSRTVLVIGWMDLNYHFQVCRLERFDSHDEPGYVLEQVAQRCMQYKVRLIAADGGGGGSVQNRLLVGRLGGFPNFYGIYYSATDHEPQRDGVLTKWTVSRTGTIGNLFSRIKKEMIHFPCVADCGSYLDEFVCETIVHDDINRTVKYTHPDTQQDDALHACNYAMVVAARDFNASKIYAS
jgi:hypothetical protein